MNETSVDKPVKGRHRVIVIGAGQAGLSISAVLKERGIDHVVFESRRVGERWRSARWDSFCLVTPNWATRLAGDACAGPEPDAFMGRDELVAYLEDYARSRELPIETGVTVTSVRDGETAPFTVATSVGVFEADRVVVATGTHQVPRFPSIAQPGQGSTDAMQPLELHASEYRNPAQFEAGSVLVVGAGQSGAQIAEELNDAGRQIWLATSRVGRLPRTYLGVDSIAWQYRLGFLDRPASELETPAHRFRADPHLSGKDGGHTIDLRDLSGKGVNLLGRLTARDNTGFSVASDLEENLRFADDFAAQFKKNVDRFVAADQNSKTSCALRITAGVDDSPVIEPDRLTQAARLKLTDHNIKTIIWATGFSFDFSWIKFPVFDDSGYPIQIDGCTVVTGLHFLGLNYVDTRGSGILYGVGADAEKLGALIAET